VEKNPFGKKKKKEDVFPQKKKGIMPKHRGEGMSTSLMTEEVPGPIGTRAEREDFILEIDRKRRAWFRCQG